jgi:hypothetical protein
MPLRRTGTSFLRFHLQRLRNLLKEKDAEIERLTRDAGDAQALDHSALATQNQIL